MTTTTMKMALALPPAALAVPLAPLGKRGEIRACLMRALLLVAEWGGQRREPRPPPQAALMQLSARSDAPTGSLEAPPADSVATNPTRNREPHK